MPKDNLRLEIESNSTDDTIKIGQTIGTNLKGSEVIELISDLGGGKTTLAKGLAKGAKSKELVVSPSFTILNEYAAPKFIIYHFDFYRLNDPGIIRRELAEAIKTSNNVIVIEWPGVIKNILPNNRLRITINPTLKEGRQITIYYPKSLEYLLRGVI